MPNMYDDSKFGVLERIYFYGTFQGTTSTDGDALLLKRFYFKGPVVVKKVGLLHLATMGGTETLIQFKKDNTNFGSCRASTDATLGDIASMETDEQFSAGSKLSASNLGTTATGSVALFVDFVRKYSSAWDVEE